MTHVYERLSLNCSYPDARARLRGRLPFGVRLKIASATGEATILARCERTRDPLGFDEQCSVRWAPEGVEPFPRFRGQVVLRNDRAGDPPVLELMGEFAPPLAAQGAFDLTSGAKLAAAIGRRLLRQIAFSLEQGDTPEQMVS